MINKNFEGIEKKEKKENTIRNNPSKANRFTLFLEEETPGEPDTINILHLGY